MRADLRRSAGPRADVVAVTTMTLTHDSTFVGRGEDPARAVDIVERLWLNALWGGRSSDGILTAMAQGSGFSGKRCFITGAASGIGRATALKLAADGAELYLTDRDAEGLEKTVADARALGAQVPEHRALDISDYDEVAAFAEHIHASHPAMDVVMNIAGVSAWGTVDQLTHQHWKSMIDINLMGPIHVIETFVPPMLAARKGRHLVNVLGRRPGGAAVARGLQRKQVRSSRTFGGARFDLARYRIGVSMVVPGAVTSPGADGSDRRRGPRGSERERWTARFGSRAVSPQYAADRILRGLRRNRFLIYTSPESGAVRVKRVAVVAVQRRDAAGQRVVPSCAAAGARISMVSSSTCCRVDVAR